MLWQGQRIAADVERACSETEWDRDSLQGQCFGLGDRQKGVESAEECRDHCCKTSGCETWQWRDDKGCFAGKSTNCIPPDEKGPFQGRRKKLRSRTYAPPARSSTFQARAPA